MYKSLISLTIHIPLLYSITTPINRIVPYIEPDGCNDIIDECLLKSAYVIRQFTNQSVMSWDEARDLCFNPNDDEVDGMATLDVSPKAIIDTSLDEQFDLLRDICAKHPQNNDGRTVNCWVGGKLNHTRNGYIFSSIDTNHLDYHVKNGDTTRWACIRNNDGSCQKDIEGKLDNGDDYITLFNSRDYFFADWPRDGGHLADFQVTAVVCNSNHFSYIDRCQCFCNSCEIYGDPHINTFDGVNYHLKGKCAYEAVTPCTVTIGDDGTFSKKEFNEDFPIEISTENAECFGGYSSCLYAVYVSLYNTFGILQTVIKFEHKINNNKEIIETTVEFEKKGELQLEGIVDVDISQAWIEIAPDEHEPWSFLLSKNNDYYVLGIWTHTKYQTAGIEFRDLNGLKPKDIHFASSRITLSSCFADKTCGICGYYDDDKDNEFVIRDANSDQLARLPITDNEDISDPFDDDASDIIQDFSNAWIDYTKSMHMDEQCTDIEIYDDLCELEYCDDNCICDDTNIVSTYNGMKQIQCNYDLSACLANEGIIANSAECNEWKNNNQQQRKEFLLQNVPHCAELVDHYCCHGSFCPKTPDFCKDPTTKDPTTKPTIVPTPGPTREPTDKPTDGPTDAPTAGPTPLPTITQLTPDPTDAPSNDPTTSPVTDNHCLAHQASDIDIIFLVDNSCGLPENECANQQDGISELLASIKGGSDPRVGYMTFGDTQNINTVIRLIDDRYNDIDNNLRGEKNRIQLIEEVRNYDCGPVLGYSDTDLIIGINIAMNELRFAVNDDTINRDRKIVIFSNCQHNSDTVNPCDLMNGDDLIIEGKPVEIIVVNIPVIGSAQPAFKANEYLQCFSGGEQKRFIVLQDATFSSFGDNINQFVTAVCENDTPTKSPTDSPTNPPSPEPTPNPTKYPSKKPSQSPVTFEPTFSPLEGPCSFNYDADVIFVVDASCGMDEGQCDRQQEFISNIVQSIKSSNQPRVSYIDCDKLYSDDRDNLLLIRLNDAVFNHNSKLPNEEQLRSLYFDFITERTKCNENSDTVFRKQCINIALEEFKSFSKNGTAKKLVIYSACSSDDDVCELHDMIEEEDIEVVLINVENHENECLLRDLDKDLVHELPEIDDWNEQNTQDVMGKVTNAICQQPTDQPTEHPSARATIKPTATPTERATAIPTFNPISSPTSSPVESTCNFEGDADILFVVDTTCGLDEKTCTVKRQFISDLVQSIKKFHNPRVGLVECGQSFGTHYTIQLSDPSFNYINDNNELSKSARDDLYFTKFKTRLQCLAGSSIPKYTCLSDTVNIFKAHSNPGERIRKIVYIQICPNSRRQSACNTKSEIFNNNIEIILVNIGDQVTSGYNDCIFWNGQYNLYRFDDFDFKTPEAIEIKQRLISHICTSNQFHIKAPQAHIVPSKAPTKAPTTKAPTNNPTNKPTDGPTNKPTTKKCAPNNKWAQFYSDDSSEPCDDSDSDESAPKPTLKPIRGRRNRWPTKKPTWKTSKPTSKPTTKARWPTKKPTWKTRKPTSKPTRKWPTKKPTPKPVSSNKWKKNNGGSSDYDSDNYYYVNDKQRYKNKVIDASLLDSYNLDGSGSGSSSDSNTGKRYKDWHNGGVDKEFSSDTPDFNSKSVETSKSSNNNKNKNKNKNNKDFEWEFEESSSKKQKNKNNSGRKRNNKNKNKNKGSSS